VFLLSVLLADFLVGKLLLPFLAGLSWYVGLTYLVVAGGLEAGAWMALPVGIMSLLVHRRVQGSYGGTVLGCTIGCVCGALAVAVTAVATPLPESSGGGIAFVTALIVLWLGAALSGARLGAQLRRRLVATDRCPARLGG
jgi:hypothetical protein